MSSGHFNNAIRMLRKLNYVTFHHRLTICMFVFSVGWVVYRVIIHLEHFDITPLPRCLSNFRAIGNVWTWIPRLRDITRSCSKTLVRLVNKGPAAFSSTQFVKLQLCIILLQMASLGYLCYTIALCSVEAIFSLCLEIWSVDCVCTIALHRVAVSREPWTVLMGTVYNKVLL